MMDGRTLRDLLEADGWCVRRLSLVSGQSEDNWRHKLNRSRVVTPLTYMTLRKVTGKDYSQHDTEHDTGVMHGVVTSEIEVEKHDADVMRDDTRGTDETPYGDAVGERISVSCGADDEVARLREAVIELKARCKMYKDRYENMKYIMHHLTSKIRHGDVGYDDTDVDMADADV